MARVKPVTVARCVVRYGATHTMSGGKIVACTRCRGIGFFDIQGTMIKGQPWLDISTARKMYENSLRTVRSPIFLHHCMKDTKHPMNKRINQRK